MRAEVGSVDVEARTVELTFSTGAPVVRYDWMSGEKYIERLGMKPENIRLDRLNAAGPLLDAHSAWSINDQIGAVEPGSAKTDGKRATAVVRFSRREAVEPIWRDVLDKIVRSVSVGYRVHEFKETRGKENELPTRTATDWEPYEISMVPMPADIGAQVRAHQIETNTCIITRAETLDQDADADRLRVLRLLRVKAHNLRKEVRP
jgi:hypothetical protein